MAFRVGDIVQPRYGGGPRMKVDNTAISGGNEWVGVWGANDGCHNYFAAELLQSAQPKDEPTGTGTPARLCNSPTSWLRS